MSELRDIIVPRLLDHCPATTVFFRTITQNMFTGLVEIIGSKRTVGDSMPLVRTDNHQLFRPSRRWTRRQAEAAGHH